MQAEFGAVLTRRRFCELVGIHATTLRRWEKAGVVRPRLESILNSPTYVFERNDVAFGRRLAGVLAERAGSVTLSAAAEIVRKDLQGRSSIRQRD